MSKNKSAAASDAAQRTTPNASLDERIAPDKMDFPQDVLTLELADLVHDSNGEIVLFNDSHLPAMAVRAESRPVASGEVGAHVTAAGDDVTGYRFVAFGDGTKIYYQDSVDLVVVDSGGGLHG